jgi:hypothetical protein
MFGAVPVQRTHVLPEAHREMADVMESIVTKKAAVQ